MNWAAMFYILGWLVSGFGVAMLVPAGVATLYVDSDAGHFLQSALMCLLGGVSLIFLHYSAPRALGHREGFLLTVVIWLLLSLLGAMPMYASGLFPSFIDALFETVSGLTTTGASVMVNLDEASHGLLLWRAMLQWLGGMGVIVLMVAVMPFLGVGGMQLYRSEMPGVVTDKLQPRLKETAKLLWIIYLFFTVMCATAYMLAGMSIFDAITHAFTTTATGGFSTHDASFGHFDSPVIEGIAVFFMITGSMNYAMHYLALTGHSLSVYRRNSEVMWFLQVLGLSVALVFVILYVSGWYSGSDAFRHALFNTVSVMTTTGFATVDYAQWPVLVALLMLALMFIGGCTGSTAGGMKALRVMLIIRQGERELNRLVHPSSVQHIKIGRRMVPEHVVQAVWSFAGLYILCFILLAFGLAAFGSDQVTAFSAAAATLTGLGPGLGDVGPGGTYAGLAQPAKLLLCVAMLLGRLEIFTVLVIFTIGFWRK